MHKKKKVNCAIKKISVSLRNCRHGTKALRKSLSLLPLITAAKAIPLSSSLNALPSASSRREPRQQTEQTDALDSKRACYSLVNYTKRAALQGIRHIQTLKFCALEGERGGGASCARCMQSADTTTRSIRLQKGSTEGAKQRRPSRVSFLAERE